MQGVTMNTGMNTVGGAQGEVDVDTTRGDFSDPLKQKGDFKRTGAADSVVDTKAATEAQRAAERNRQALKAREHHDSDDEDDDTAARVASMRFQDPLSGAGGAKSKGNAKAASKFSLGGGDPCAACGKSVGFADKKTAIGAIWHKDCFKCCHCNKILDSSNALDAGGKPCCKACHSRHHGPKGIGFGFMADTGLGADGKPAQ